LFQRLRKFAQTTTYLGIAVIIIVWCVVIYLTHGEHQRAYEDGLRQGSNLSRIFQQYISRVVGGADTTLKALRDLYQSDPEDFDMSRLADIGQLQDDLIGQFAIFGADGFMKLGTLSSRSSNNVTDRDYFRVQADAKTDELYISVPLIGRLSHRSVFVLARRLTARDGTFDGLAVATINIRKLEDFYNSIDIGRRGSVSLDGFDGIVRVRAGRDPAGQDLVGKSFADTKLFSLFRQSPTGHYWNFEQSVQPLDGVRRLISYQNVDGLPLIAVVASAESDIFEQADSTAHRYYLFAFVLTAAVIVAIGIGAKRQEKLSATLAALEQSKSSLERVNLWFNTALMNMMHGLSMFDKDQRLILCNDRYREIYRLALDRSMPGTTLLSLLKDRMVDKRPEEVEAYVEEHMRSLYRLGSAYDEIKLLDGRVIARACQTMPNGGWVTIHEDITDRKRADEHQALLISELDHRVKNILARVAVVAKYTLEGRCPKKELAEALDRRIQSMADAHAMLSQSHWLGVSLGDLVRRQLAPYATETNIAISGPDTTLSPAQAQAMAMVLQELATNAVKYGSLSTSHGKVSVTWDCRDGADGAACVAIAWQETGGPRATAPTQTSYGTNLIRNLIPHELGGTVELVFAPEGVRCLIEIPLETQLANKK
jgi:two-component sensor histidine kinase/PAS domain-containing protein